MLPTVSGNRPRITEAILGAYFAYTLLLAAVLPMAATVRVQSICASLAALAVLHYLAGFAKRHAPVLLRDLLPIPFVLLAYQQIGLFAQPQESHLLEESWVRWDRLLLVDWGLKDSIEALGPTGPGFLELLYVLTYVVGPLGLLILYVSGHIDRADRYLAVFVGSAVASYALYPFFPSEPPRTVFPGDLTSAYDTVFRKLNWWILGGAGIHTSVFPSGHVSSACGVGIGLLFAMPERKRYGIAVTAVALGIALATVYGRYHYAVDALAGMVVSCVASLICFCAFRWRDSA